MIDFKKIFIGLRYGGALHPARDWFVLLILAFMLLVSAAVWSAWLFSHVANGGTLAGTATSTAPIFNQASLDEVEKVFNDRAAREKAYTEGAHHFIDPSK